MKWKSKLSAEQIKIWKERILILVLSGVLLLVIFLPVEKADSGMWGSGGILGETEGETAQEPGQGGTDEEGKDTAMRQGADESGYDMTVTGADSYVETLELRLAKTLSCMDGVGAVKVMITLRDGGEEIVEKDMPSSRSITTENDGDGGSRNVNEYEGEEVTIYYTESDGSQTPYVVNRKEPQIGGIVVVAQGGGNKKTAAEITGAIEALFDIEPHKIKVVRMTTLGK